MISLAYVLSNLVILEMLISICLVYMLQCYKEQYVSDDAASD
jgi:presenilin-like A22 family membrane protease